MKRIRYRAFLGPLALLLAAALMLSGCGLFDILGGKEEEASSEEEPTEEEFDPEYPVAAGGITLLGRPGKVVSLAPSQTEKLYDLGLEGRLVGVSDYCDFPRDVIGMPICGTAQMPDLDEIRRLGAHLVLTETPLGDEATAVLAENEIDVAVLPHAGSVNALMDNYVDLARMMEGNSSGAAIGEAFVDRYLSELSRIEQAVSGQEGRKALYLRLLDFTVATGDTFENELMGRIGLENIAEGYTGWEYPADEAKSADGTAAFSSVDVIYMDPDTVTIKDLERSDFYRGLPAVIQDRYLYISSIEMERQSLRTLFLLEDMAAYAYPDAGLGARPDAAEGDGGGEEEPDHEEPDEGAEE